MTKNNRSFRLLGKGVMGLLTRADVTATLSVLSLAVAPALAGPEGEQVVRGDVRFERRGNEMWITAGRNSIINYRSFNIGANEAVRFIQPDASSRVLNRVTTAAPTHIDGSLFANGRVYIVNPAGVYFGQNATVDVNALHAAAGTMTNRDFLGNVDRFTNLRGQVMNEGAIRANAVTLVGQQVGNFGSIVAPQGTVVLAAGQDVIVGQRDGNVVVRIPRAATSGLASVTNTGQISVSGGSVAMVAGDMLGAAMFNSGRIAANNVRIEAQGHSSATISGQIDATRASAAGGTVRILAEHVALQDATIDASGTTGGTIMVGGNFLGRGPESRSQTTSVDAGSMLRADGTASDAGSVVVWSDGTTRFDGSIEARALGAVGSGGVAEVSGKEHVSVGGHAYLQGKTGIGMFTIDPGSVNIVDGPNTGPGGALDTFNDAWIINQMNTGGATLNISTANSTNAAAQNLTVDAAANLSYSSANLLILDGGNSVTVSGIINNSGQGGLALTGGAISVNAAITVGGSMVTNGTSFTNSAVITAGRDVTLTQTAAVNVNANINAGMAFNSVNAGIGGTFDSTGVAVAAAAGDITISHAGDAVTVGNVTGSNAIAVTGANVIQSGTAAAQSYGITATGSIAVNGAVALAGASGFTASSASFTNTAGGTISANNAAGLITINTTAGNVTLGGALTAGTGGITLASASSGQVNQNAAATTTGAYTATASGQFDAGATITGGSIVIQGGASGTGNLDLNASTLHANSISLRAGDGASGGNSGIVNLTGNPTFANTAGSGRPTTFSMRQDASIADAGIAALARFQTGSIAGMNYTLQSDAGSITNSTATKVNGSNLTLVGQSGVTLSADLSLASLDVTGPTTLSADVTTGTGATRFRNAVDLGASTRSLTSGTIAFDAGATSTGGGLGITNSGTLTVGGAIALTGAGVFVQNGSGGVALNAGVSTQNQNLSFSGPMTLGANATLNSGTATVTLANSVALVDKTLTLTGDEVNFGAAGSVTGTGGSLVVQPSASGVSIGVGGGAGTLDLSAADIAALGTGISSITIGRSGGNHAITIDASTFASATTFRAGLSGSIAVNGDLTGTGAGAFTLQGATTLNADIVTDSHAITITGDVILGTGQTDYTLDTTNANASTGANISISGTTNSETAGLHGLNLRAGTGNVSMGNVGDTAGIDFLRVVNANNATFGSVVADFVLQNAGTGLTTFGNITATDAVNLSGTQFSFQDATVNGGFGFLVNNSGAAAFHGDLTLEGQLLQSGSGAASLGGDVTTTNDAVTFNAPVTLTANSALTTGNGNVSFASTLDGAHTLTITTTNGDAAFAGAIGGTTAVGDLSVASRAATFSGAVRATTLSVNAKNDVSLAGDVTGTTISLVGGNDGTGNLLFTSPGINLAADNITLSVGDAAPGGLATLNLATNTPTFRGSAGGSTSPTSLSLTQDAAFTDADLPGAAAFGNGLAGLTYTITSRDGNVVIAAADKVNDTFLTVNGTLGVNLQTPALLLRSFTTSSNTALNGNIQSSGNITIGGILTLGGDSALNSGLAATTLDDVVAGTHDFAVTADSLALNGDLTGTGILVLQPGSASRDIRLAGAADTGSFFELNDAELGHITEGWSQVYLGKSDGSGLLYLGGDLAVTDPTIFRMNGSGGRMDLGHKVTGTGNASLRFLSSGNITLYDDVATSGNFMEFTGNLVLGADALIDSTNAGAVGTGADISFRGLIDSAPSSSHALSVIAGVNGSARLEREVGFFHDLSSLTISGRGIQLSKVSTANAQTYNGIVYLGGDATSTTGGSITFGDWIFLTADSDIISAGGVGNNITVTGGIDSLTAGQEKNVRLNSGSGNLSIGANSGSSVKLAGFGATGADITTHGVRAIGNVTYTGPTSLGADIEGAIVTFNDDLILTGNTGVVASSSASFAGTVNSQANQGHNLIVSSPVTTFIGLVGEDTPRELGRLATSGATNINCDAIHTNGSISLGGNVQLNSDVTFAAGAGGLEFLGGINSDSTGTPRSIILNCPGQMFLSGSIGNANRLASITTGGGGTIRVAAPVLRTVATQDYASAVIVDGDTAFSGSSISFASTINAGTNGPHAVAVTSVGGSVTFSAAVGGTSPLSSFNVTATSFTVPSVTTTGSQTYTGITTLTGNLTSTTAGAIAVSGVTQFDHDITISTAGHTGDNVAFASTVNAKDASHALTVNAGTAGNVTFGSDIGLGTGATDHQLSSLTITGGNVSINGVQTSGSQSISGTTTVRGSLTSTGSGSISLQGAVLLGTNLVLTTASGGIFVDATVNSESSTRSLTLSSGGNSVKRLGRAIGETAQLSTITVNGDGTTVLAAPSIKTSGNQTYSGPVTLGNNISLSSPAAVTFVGTVDSDSITTPRSLTVDSTGGVAGTSAATFSGAVGSVVRLSRLQTAGPGTARLGGNVTVSSAVDFFGPVKLLASLTIDAKTGTQTFRSTIDTETSLSPANLTLLSTRSDLEPDRAPFKFGGSIGGTNALANLTIGGDLAAPSRAASMVFTDSFDTSGRVLASGVAATDSFTITTTGNFLMGAGQKLTSFGRLRINAGGSATLGDLTSIADITVNSNNIILRARANGPVYDNDFQTPDVLPMDTGTDYVAAGGFFFSTVPTVVGSGSAPSFASNSGIANANLGNFAFRRFTGNVTTSRFTDTRSGGTNFLLPLDLRAIGASSVELATSLAAAIPRDSTPGEVVTPPPITSSMQSSLADMGIQTRGLTAEETIDFLVGNATYDDVRPRSGLVADDYRVATNRLTAPAARRAIDAYRTLVFRLELDAQGKPIVDASGNQVLSDRTGDIKASLARAWESYATKATNPSGVGFRAFLENRGPQATSTETQALKDLNAARDALTSIRAIGLSEYEASIPRRKILGMIRPDSISEQQLVEAVFGAPVRA